jgi:glycerol-3-phosphate dehydrogenase
MLRQEIIERINRHPGEWDVLVIGGGATGLGTALDSASRGFSTLLLEQSDFAKGTSSRSTKLVHGGVRYLQQGDISLVLEALHERGLLLQNAPHLVHNLSFIIPNYDWWDGPFYGIGLKLYDMLAGKYGFGPSTRLSREVTLSALPMVIQEGLRGGVMYHDGQFDDARMAIAIALTAIDYGAVLANYIRVTGLLKKDGLVSGVEAVDELSGSAFRIPAKVVINATGVFGDAILKMDNPAAPDLIRPSQGVHLVLGREFLASSHAVLVPHTSDGRVLFAVPWHGKVVVGTTDTLVDHVLLEPRAREEEIDFILENAGRYLAKKPTRRDVRSVFAGLRPLAAPKGEEEPTKEISRHHKILISVSGLLTVTGGKWTTYRKMAEDAVDSAIDIAGLPARPGITRHLLLHGYDRHAGLDDPLSVYGSDRAAMRQLMAPDFHRAAFSSEQLYLHPAQVLWAVKHEMAVRLEDVLARRTRALLLDARESLRLARPVAEIMAGELGHGPEWVEQQLDSYHRLAEGYILQ